MRFVIVLFVLFLFLGCFVLSSNYAYGGGTMVIRVLDYYGRPLSNATVIAAQRGVGDWKLVTNSTGYVVLNGVDFSNPIGVFVYYMGREVYSGGLTPKDFIVLTVSVFDVNIKAVDLKFRGVSNMNVSLSYSTLFNVYTFSNITDLNGVAHFSRLPNGTYDYVITSKWGISKSGSVNVNNSTYNSIVLSIPVYQLVVRTVDINGSSVVNATVRVMYNSISESSTTNNSGISVFKGLPSNRTYYVIAFKGILFSSASVYLDNDKNLTLVLTVPGMTSTSTTSSTTTSSTTTTASTSTTSALVTTTTSFMTTSSVGVTTTSVSGNVTSKEFGLVVNVKWSDGETVAGAVVKVYNSKGELVKSGIAATGSIKFSLVSGSYFVEASLYNVSDHTDLFNLSNDFSVTLVLDMKRANIPIYEFKLRVVWYDGNPVDGALVQISKSGIPVDVVITDNNGFAKVSLMGGFIYNYNVTSSKYGRSTAGWFPLTDQVALQSTVDGYAIYLGDNPLPPYTNILFLVGIIGGYVISIFLLFGKRILGILKRKHET